MVDEHIPQPDDSARDGSDDVTEAFREAIADGSQLRYVLSLYVTGMRPRSQRAIDNIRRLCEEHLRGRYELRVFDLYQQPELAESAQILAAPTLVKELPAPLRKLIGDMSDEGRVMVALGIEVPKKPQDPSEGSPGGPS